MRIIKVCCRGAHQLDGKYKEFSIENIGREAPRLSSNNRQKENSGTQ
jgi:hypothetical protein